MCFTEYWALWCAFFHLGINFFINLNVVNGILVVLWAFGLIHFFSYLWKNMQSFVIISVNYLWDVNFFANFLSRSIQVTQFFFSLRSSWFSKVSLTCLSAASHRNIVRMPVLMRELWLEMWHDIHPDKKSNFVTKGGYQQTIF